MEAVSARVLLRGLWPHAPAGLAVTDVVTDSREVRPGCLFVAIKGARADGHDFAADAFRQGAALVLGERAAAGVPPDKMVVVPSALRAMTDMGANYRERYSPLVLAVTGSVGKTTTKEFCAAIFSSFGQTLKTEGNQNNEIGLPKTLFRLSAGVRYAVLEMGMQGEGEIRALSLAARPGGAVITRIGMAHMQQLGSVENILRAKLEVCEGLPAGGLLVLNGDDEMLRAAALPGDKQVVWAGLQNPVCDVRAHGMRREARGVAFDIDDRQYGRREAFIPAQGRHNVQNALLAYTAATRFGLSAQQAADALAAFQPAGNRQRFSALRGAVVIEDFYNAGPESMRAALDTLAEQETAGRRVAVLGDMLELGAVSGEAHRELGRLVAKAGVSLLVTVGELAALAAAEAEKAGVKTLCCGGNAEAAQALRAELSAGDVLLMKASRGMRFEEIAERLRE